LATAKPRAEPEPEAKLLDTFGVFYSGTREHHQNSFVVVVFGKTQVHLTKKKHKAIAATAFSRCRNAQ
jgi:hypothetical protein